MPKPFRFILIFLVPIRVLIPSTSGFVHRSNAIELKLEKAKAVTRTVSLSLPRTLYAVMKWLWSGQLSRALLICILFLLEFVSSKNTSRVRQAGWSSTRKLAARERTRELWNHGFDNYMAHAFPADELAPLSCSGLGPDWDNPQNIARNDVNGNFSLTLVDVLDTFVVLGDHQGFSTAVKNVISHVSFDVDTKPQVFETTIRMLGGLLSGHIFASKVGSAFYLDWYRGELLDLAHDLGERLLPAFKTPTGIPFARINLRRGIIKGETVESCTAGGGSLILEFGVLSRLTGDDRFEKAAYKAYFALWNRRSNVGLVGNTINTATGNWTSPEITSIGAGIDSFYEYALKWYILSGEIEFLDVWDDSYAALMRYSRAPDGFWYHRVHISNGALAYSTTDSLSAFWSGLQVLAGDVNNAIKSHLMYWHMWRRHSGLPEVWDIGYGQATSTQYPLRPEFIESTWYLYRATKDPFYLDVGERVLNDLVYRARVECGLTGIKDLKSNARDDRMESFALSETLKYLFLLFDEENEVHSDSSNYVFTTEGHILTLDTESLKPMSATRRKLRGSERHQCPAYASLLSFYDESDGTGLAQGIRSHPYYDYARIQVGISPEIEEEYLWTPYGWCEKPNYDLFSYDFVLSADGKSVPEDLNPGKDKIHPVKEGYMLLDVTGIRTQIVRRLDNKGYDITKLGPYPIRSGQLVLVNDLKLNLGESSRTETQKPDLSIRLVIENNSDLHPARSILADLAEQYVTAQTSHFGGSLPLDGGSTSTLTRDPSNLQGCNPYRHSTTGILVVKRGDCTFVEKLFHARNAGAKGVIVLSDEELAINPTASKEELEEAGPLAAVGLVVLKHSQAKLLSILLDHVERDGSMSLVAHRDPTQKTAPNPETIREERIKDPSRMLYLNGHALLNTRLLI